MKTKKYYNFLSKRLMSIYVIYITVLTLVAYSMCLIYVRNDFRRTEKQYLSTLSDSLENHLSYVTDITATLTNNQTIVNFSAGGKDIEYEELTKVVEAMRQTNIINNFGSEFAVINSDAGTVVTAEGSMSVDFFESKVGMEKNFLKKKLTDITNFGKNSVEIMTSKSESYNTSYLITLIALHHEKSKPIIFVSMYNLDALFKNRPNDHLPQIINLKIDKNNVMVTYDSEEEPHIKFEELSKRIHYKTVSEYKKSTGFWGNISTSVYVSAISY